MCDNNSFVHDIYDSSANKEITTEKIATSNNMAPKRSFKYAPLLLFQIVLMVLFFVFVRYKQVAPPAPGSPGFEGTHVMIFIGFGFLMTFLKKYCYSALGFNWLLAAMVVQWAMFCQQAFEMEDGYIQVGKKQMLEADIMAATVLITFGALLGVASGTQLIVIAIIETAIGCANIYLVLNVLKAADAGGSIAIHAYGAYFGLACSFAMNRGKNKNVEEAPEAPKLDEPTYISDITATLGSIFLWIYWPSFNSAIVNTHTEYDRAVLNTYLSLAAATVTTFMVSSLVSHDEGKFDMVHVQNSTLAGGVAVGAVANMYVSPGGAIAIGTAAGIISVLGYKYLTPKLAKLGILDTCGVNNLHGMPAVFSGILSIIFAALATESEYKKDLGNVFPAMNSVTDKGESQTPRTAKEQALMQLAALAATVGIALVGGFVTGMIAKLKVFRPLSKEVQYNDENDWEVPH
ncbi:ammonium transporter family domain-containing protein [Phthorimaea operculella]|nr:ammonium transporter family domain-containing protein [Phthorimaea operculella]